MKYLDLALKSKSRIKEEEGRIFPLLFIFTLQAVPQAQAEEHQDHNYRQ